MRINFTVTHDPYGTSTVIDDVQDISAFTGKRKLSDPIRPDSTIITGRNAAGLPAIKLYDYVTVEGYDVTNNEQQISLGGSVIDFEIDYGFISSEDRWTITIQAGSTELATTVFTSGSFTAGETLESGISDLTAALPGSWLITYGGLPNLRLSALTFDGLNAAEVIDKFAATGALSYTSGEDSLTFAGPYAYTLINGGTPVNYTDTGAGTGPLKYDRLGFSSLADNFATVIKIDPDTGSTVTVGTGNRTETFNTYSYDTAEATSLAQYYELLYSNDGITPDELSFIWSTIPSQTNFYPGSVGCLCNVTFRGTTYQTVIIGAAYTASPEDVRTTFYLVPIDVTDYLVLDSTTLGILDTNRLGL